MTDSMKYFLLMLPIGFIFFTFLAILMYRAFFADKRSSKGKLTIAALASAAGIITLIISMVNISKYIHALNAAKVANPDAPFTWSFLPYVIIMLLCAVVMIYTTLTSKPKMA